MVAFENTAWLCGNWLALLFSDVFGVFDVLPLFQAIAEAAEAEEERKKLAPAENTSLAALIHQKQKTRGEQAESFFAQLEAKYGNTSNSRTKLNKSTAAVPAAQPKRTRAASESPCKSPSKKGKVAKSQKTSKMKKTAQKFGSKSAKRSRK